MAHYSVGQDGTKERATHTTYTEYQVGVFCVLGIAIPCVELRNVTFFDTVLMRSAVSAALRD